MPDQSDIAARILAILQLTEPELDLSVGSLPRKLVDAASAPIADLTVDTHLINYQYDVDSKSSGALDDFVALFGITRVPTQRAVGVVTFSRSASIAASRVAHIPIGTQVVANTLQTVTVQTTVSAVIDKGQTSIDVPVQATTAGPIGNVAGGTLVGLPRAIDGITAVTNAQPLLGGTNQETDVQLRARFKSTVFRNLAGTDDMYRAMALQFSADPTDTNSRRVTQVNVVGPQKTWTEQVAITTGSASSSITDAVYIYPNSLFVSDTSGTMLQLNADYTVTINNAVNPATLTVNGLSGADGTIYNLQFDYVSSYSRNDPQGNRFGDTVAINNRIDLWINGLINRTASQAPKFVTSSALRFNTVTNDPLNLNRFSTLDGKHPADQDVFVPLGFGPIVAVPNTITVASTTYTEGTHYDIVHQSDAFGYTSSSKAGLVWYMAAGSPAANTVLPTISYTYNALPGRVQALVDGQWRLLGTDVKVHAGVAKLYRFHFAVVYDPRFTAASVNNAINAALADYVNQLGFDSGLQVSDVLQAVHNVPGVDNVRFLTSTDDATNYGIQQMLSTGVAPDSSFVPPYGVSASGGRAKDVYFDDASYPVFFDTRIIAKAKNTFGVS